MSNIAKRNLYLILFYFLSFTWGIITTSIGLVVMLVLLPFRKVRFDRGRFYAVVGKNWGGLELGCFYLVCKNCETDKRIVAHEGFGHSAQNCILGPLFPFVVAIPSATRYWLIEQKTYEGKKRFAVILYSIVVAVSIILAVLLPEYWLILPAFLTAYGTILLFWLWFVEIPQYKEKPYPKYDDIWFEGTATNWGLQLMNWYDKMTLGEDD